MEVVGRGRRSGAAVRPRRSGPGGSVDDTQFSLVPRAEGYAYAPGGWGTDDGGEVVDGLGDGQVGDHLGVLAQCLDLDLEAGRGDDDLRPEARGRPDAR